MPVETQAGAEGPHARLTRLMERYEPALWRLVHSYEADSSRREDLFQEIALGLWKAIPHFRGASSERTWLYQIAHNIAISTLARRRRERSEMPMEDTFEPATAAEHPDQALLLREKREAMLAAIRQLPAIDRQVVLLHLEGLGYEEIEHVSGLSQSAIATRLSRIRTRLTQAVQKKEVRE
jgi:RNA polymerase sigma-70 factor (ECF subfamily)